jgi:hypothetical protein
MQLKTLQARGADLQLCIRTCQHRLLALVLHVCLTTGRPAGAHRCGWCTCLLDNGGFENSSTTLASPAKQLDVCL